MTWKEELLSSMHQEVMMVKGFQTNYKIITDGKITKMESNAVTLRNSAKMSKTDEIRNDKAVLRDKQMFKRQILITMRKGTLAKYDFREQ